jgi:hypothetical protein
MLSLFAFLNEFRKFELVFLLQVIKAFFNIFSTVLLVFVLLHIATVIPSMLPCYIGIFWFPVSLIIDWSLKSKIRSLQNGDRNNRTR